MYEYVKKSIDLQTRACSWVTSTGGDDIVGEESEI